MTLLQIQAVTRRFGGVCAVDEVSTTVSAGEIRGLIGPNGAGKTTLLNLISGALPTSAGRVLLDGEDVTQLRADQRAARGVRRTFQNLKLFGEMSVLLNVMVGLHASTRAGLGDALLGTRRHRGEEAWALEQARRALVTVGLGAAANLSAASLAYGHRRLLEIARALVAQPKLLLLDEPAQGMNPTEAMDLVRLIQKINESGVTVVLVEHHMQVVMSACTRITVLNYGRKIADDTPAAVQRDTQVIDAYLGVYHASEPEPSHA